jgi:tetratricopeptide (TPR) repeat protein
MSLRLLLLLAPGLCLAQPDPLILESVFASSLIHNYQEAQSRLAALADSFPDHPAIPFCQAAVCQSMMLDYESRADAPFFYTHINRAIALAEKNRQDPWCRFYLGAALSYKSYQLAGEKKYPSALSAVLRSMKELNKLVEQDSSFCEPLLGKGNYLFWRSKIISWLPFVADQRAQGKRLVQKAYDCSRLSRWAALSSLCWITLDEKNYDETVLYAQKGLARFPESRFFLWPLAEALFRDNKYEQALFVYEKILVSLIGIQPNNHYNEIVLHWKLAQCEEQVGHVDRAAEHCRQVLSLHPALDVRERSADEKEGAQRMLKKLAVNN